MGRETKEIGVRLGPRGQGHGRENQLSLESAAPAVKVLVLVFRWARDDQNGHTSWGLLGAALRHPC